MKILLLEDDVILSEIIEEFLNELGYKVEVCFDGEEAILKVYSQRFDLLLLDINVPLTNGIEFLTLLRQNNNTTPAIFITSLNTSKDLANGFKAFISSSYPR
jgi:DNA-binding response OmpR family regulator